MGGGGVKGLQAPHSWPVRTPKRIIHCQWLTWSSIDWGWSSYPDIWVLLKPRHVGTAPAITLARSTLRKLKRRKFWLYESRCRRYTTAPISATHAARKTPTPLERVSPRFKATIPSLGTANMESVTRAVFTTYRKIAQNHISNPPRTTQNQQVPQRKLKQRPVGDTSSKHCNSSALKKITKLLPQGKGQDRLLSLLTPGD